MLSKNIIFVDGEFAKLKNDGIDLIAVALVKLSGEELYLEISHDGPLDPWVEKNVSPHLKGPRVSQREAAEKIRAFVGAEKPLLAAYVPTYDLIGLCRLFEANSVEEIEKRLPFHWCPVDLASLLFERGVKPGAPLADAAKTIGVDISGFQPHHALSDARLTKKLYEKIFSPDQIS